MSFNCHILLKNGSSDLKTDSLSGYLHSVLDAPTSFLSFSTPSPSSSSPLFLDLYCLYAIIYNLQNISLMFTWQLQPHWNV